MDNEKIAHDLAVEWAKLAVQKLVKPMTSDKSMVEEYLAAYQYALKKLNRSIKHATAQRPQKDPSQSD